MKKEYQKPYLAVESFQLNAAIATGCSSEGKLPIHYTENQCRSGDDEGELLSVFIGAACEVDVVNGVGGDGNDTLCYQGPIDPYAVFIKS